MLSIGDEHDCRLPFGFRGFIPFDLRIQTGRDRGAEVGGLGQRSRFGEGLQVKRLGEVDFGDGFSCGVIDQEKVDVMAFLQRLQKFQSPLPRPCLRQGTTGHVANGQHRQTGPAKLRWSGFGCRV